MVKTFHIDHAVHDICPDCIREGHVKRDIAEYFDCKNVFVDDQNNIVGQCCCSSIEHGKRT